MFPFFAHGETLLAAYRLAQQNDPKFKAAQFEGKAGGMAIDQARAGFLPTARLDGIHTDTRQRVLASNNPIFGAGMTEFPTSGYTLSVTQAIYRKDVIERFAQAKAVVQQAEYTVLAAEQDLMLRTTSAYLSVLASLDALALATAERQAVGRALETARERLTAGLGTVTNMHDASARFAFNQAREIEAQNRVRDARQGLREITGKLIEDTQLLKDEFPLQTPDPAVMERWVEISQEQNFILRARREAVEVARQEVERQRAGHFPTLNLVVNHNRTDAGSTLFGGGSTTETTDVSLRLSVPIYEGGLTSAVTQEAVYRLQKAREELEQERRAVERAARAAYDGTVSGVGMVRALKEAVSSQESALGAKVEGFRAGIFTLLPVLDATRDLYIGKRDYAQARYEYLISRLKLKQAAGTLSEVDLEGINAALR